MACVNADGTLTKSAQAVLEALREPATPAEVAAKTGFPLFRIRSSLRELKEAGLLDEMLDGRYRLTAVGLGRIGDR